VTRAHAVARCPWHAAYRIAALVQNVNKILSFSIALYAPVRQHEAGVPFGTTCTLSGTLCSAKYTGVVVSDTMDVPEVLIAAQC
jgi:hypothetical protein